MKYACYVSVQTPPVLVTGLVACAGFAFGYYFHKKRCLDDKE